MKLISTRILLFALCLLTFYLKAQKLAITFAATSPDASVKIAPLKYNKDFAYSFTFDDAYDDPFTCALGIFKGGRVSVNDVLYTGEYYTDGCGNKKAWTGGVAWNSANRQNVDTHLGNVLGQMTWKQLDTLYANGWDVFNHSYSHRSASIQTMNVSDYTTEIALNLPAIKSKTAKAIETPLFVVPAGDTTYQQYAFNAGYKAVFNQSGEVQGYGGLNVEKSIDFSKVIHRQLVEESLSSAPANYFLDSVAARGARGIHTWYNEFTHRIDDVTSSTFNFYIVKNYFDRIANTYGASGTDKMWMAPLQEVSEYLLMRDAIGVQSKATATGFDINFDFSKVPKWFRRNSITLLISNSTNIVNIDYPRGWQVTYQLSGATKIVNIDFGNSLLSTATSNISPNSSGNTLFKLAPTLADDELVVEMGEFKVEKNAISTLNTAFDWQIANSFGQSVTGGKVSWKAGNKWSIDVSNYPNGNYFLSVTSNAKTCTEKFVIFR